MARVSIDRQVLGMDVPGSSVLEAKVGKYKLYIRSFLSLLRDHSNENYEFWVWLSVIHGSFIIILTCACNNYVGAIQHVPIVV